MLQRLERPDRHTELLAIFEILHRHRQRLDVPVIMGVGGSFDVKTQQAGYASLIELNELRIVNPIPCPKRDRRGWVVLHDREDDPPPARRLTRLRSVPTW